MRILILGAGTTGGYFGGRQAQAGVDVSFLVRPPRGRTPATRWPAHPQSARRCGDRGEHAHRRSAAQRAQARPLDLVLLSCKAYDLDSVLDARVGTERMIGGLCFISTVLDADGAIQYLTKTA